MSVSFSFLSMNVLSKSVKPFQRIDLTDKKKKNRKYRVYFYMNVVKPGNLKLNITKLMPSN